jgi:acyl transferase domain-containing protein
MSLEDALLLLTRRAQLIDDSPAGAMLAVPLPEEQICSLLVEHSQLSISIVSAPAQCVVGGPLEAIVALEEKLKERKTLCRRLPTTHAFHSKMLAGLHEPIAAAAQAIRLAEPQIPFVANLTGTWITAAEATSPHYWAEHTYKTVRFADALGEVLKVPDRLLVEVGPGQNLSSFVFQHPAYKEAGGLVVLPSVRNAYDQQSDRAFMLNTLGKLWLSGMDVDWEILFKKS